jgi:glutaminyl-tRNA synthetase
LAPGKEVRLKYAYYVTCKEVIKDNNGEIIEIICNYDPESKGGDTSDGRKVKGTIQWVDAETAIPDKKSIIRSIIFCP